MRLTLPWQTAFTRARTKQLGRSEIHSLLNDLKSCNSENDLSWGRRLHAKAVEDWNASNNYVGAALVKMYAKCGSMVDACCVFETIQKPDLVSWTALLLGYADSGEGLVALELFSRMKKKGYVPDSVTYIAAFKACTSLALDPKCKLNALELGRKIHSDIGCALSHYLQNTLIDMYARCGSMVDAQKVFDKIPKPDVVSWNALLLGYADSRQGIVALRLFSKMKSHGFIPNSLTYVAVIRACTCLAVNGDYNAKADCLRQGMDIHSAIGSNLNYYVQNALIDMYAKCGSMTDARRVFDSVSNPDVVSWTAVLMGYAENGEGQVALNLFPRMTCAPNSVAYVAALKACISIASIGLKQECLERGRQIHSQIGDKMDHFLQNTLIDMYSKCGSMVDARKIFDGMKKADVVSWTALLMGYAENGEGQVALDMFYMMKARGCVPDPVTYVAALKACSSMAVNGDDHIKKACLEIGSAIHSQINCPLTDHLQSALIDMYGKCGCMVEARCVFDSAHEPDVVIWNALLLGYAENGEALTTLELFSRMKSCGCIPNAVTYVSVIKACGYAGELAFGRKLHLEITEFTAQLVTILVDFYSKMGSMVEARRVFELHPNARDVQTWTALLAGYASVGDSGTVFDLYEAMQDDGLKPDGITFVCLLLCCSHAGLTEKAKQFLETMTVQHQVSPTVQHYNCMVDILGRGNQMSEALAGVRKMPCSPDIVTWTTLLGACCKWKNVEIGRLAFLSLVDMDTKDACAYVLMAHIYGSIGMWEEQEMVLSTGIKLETSRQADQQTVASLLIQVKK